MSRLERSAHDAPPALLGFARLGKDFGTEQFLDLVLVHRSSRARRERVEGAAQAGVHGAAREVEHRRDLARRVAEQVPEDDHRAVLGAERGERRHHVLAQAAVVVERSDVRHGARPRPQRAGPRPVDRAVDHDPVQPRAERPAAVEAVQRPQRRQERLLGDVLGGRRVVDDEPGGPVGRGPVAAEELVDRVRRPGLGGADERRLAPAIPRGGSGDCPAPHERYGDALRAPLGDQPDVLPGARRNRRRRNCCHLPSKFAGTDRKGNTDRDVHEVPRLRPCPVRTASAVARLESHALSRRRGCAVGVLDPDPNRGADGRLSGPVVTVAPREHQGAIVESGWVEKGLPIAEPFTAVAGVAKGESVTRNGCGDVPGGAIEPDRQSNPVARPRAGDRVGPAAGDAHVGLSREVERPRRPARDAMGTIVAAGSDHDSDEDPGPDGYERTAVHLLPIRLDPPVRSRAPRRSRSTADPRVIISRCSSGSSG